MNAAVLAPLVERGPTLTHQPLDVVSRVGAEEAAEFFAIAGIDLDPWQFCTVVESIAEREDGSWAAFEVGCIVPRQNGKGDIIEARELLGLFFLGEQLIIHTAHEFKTANEAFLRLVGKIQACPRLGAEVKSIRYANGEQGVELHNGARIKYAARTGGAGRGFAGADLVVYDEAYSLKAEQVAASLPTLSTSPNPQVWYTSSAGLEDSTLLWALRKRVLKAQALGETAGRLLWHEWTAEKVRWNAEKNRVESTPLTDAEISDEKLWAIVNPTAGERISFEYLAAEFDAMPAAQFCRERLGVFDPEPVESIESKLPAELWEATVVDHDIAHSLSGRQPVAIWFDVDLDAKSATLGIATGTLDSSYGEVVKHDLGAGWLPAAIVKLASRFEGRTVIAYVGSGPALDIAETVRVELDRLELDAELRGLTGNDYRAACGGLFLEVIEGRFKRAPGQKVLDVAGLLAPERRISEGWVWDRRNCKVPISPLVGLTAGRFVLPMTFEVEIPAPLFIG